MGLQLQISQPGCSSVPALRGEEGAGQRWAHCSEGDPEELRADCNCDLRGALGILLLDGKCVAEPRSRASGAGVQTEQDPAF